MTASWPHEPVLVVGAGPVGQTTALLLARWGVPVGRARRAARTATWSARKAICQQRDVLDIWASVGAGEQIAAEGVTWTTARTFHRDRELFAHTFADAGRSPFPPFVNISQSRTEEILDERIAAEPLIDVRWGHEVTGSTRTRRRHAARRDGSRVRLHRGCAGPRRRLRRTLGVTFDGHSFDDRFLICDIRTDLPGWATERRFYFDPAWNPGRQVLDPPLPGLDVPHRLAGARRATTSTPRRRPARSTGASARSSATGRTRSCGSRCTGSTRGSRRPDAGRPGAARRRRRAPRLAVRGPRPQLRGRRRGERRLEDRATSATAGRPRSCWRATTPSGTPRRVENLAVTTATMGFLVPPDAERAAHRADVLARAADRPRRPRAGRLRPARRAVLVRRLAADHAGPDPPVRRPPAPRRGPAARPRRAGARRARARATARCRDRGRLRQLARDGLPRAARRRRRPPAAADAAGRAGRRAGAGDADRPRTLAAALGARPGEVWVAAPGRARRRRRPDRWPRDGAGRALGQPAAVPRPSHRKENDHGVLPAAAATSPRSATPSTAAPTGASTPRS